MDKYKIVLNQEEINTLENLKEEMALRGNFQIEDIIENILDKKEEIKEKKEKESPIIEYGKGIKNGLSINF